MKDMLEMLMLEIELRRRLEDAAKKLDDFCVEYIECFDAESKKEYNTYRERLHPYEKRRCFKPKTYWKRTRSNPR